MPIDTFEFSAEVKKRLLDFPLVVPEGMSKDDDYYAQDRILAKQPLGKAQAIPVPGSKKPGYSEVYRNAASPDKLVSTYHPSITTLYEGFNAAVTKSANDPCLGERVYDYKIKGWSKQYHWQTYAEISKRRDNFGAGLVNVVSRHLDGLTPQQQKYIVSIYGPNCVNWIVADLGCQTQALPSVCLYDTLGPDTSEYILNFTESPVCIVSVANIPTILKLKPKLPNLKAVIALGPLKAELDHEAEGQSKKELLSAWAENVGVGLYAFDEIEKIGEQNPLAHNPPTRDDIYALNFTSGTTGNPKGALLTHANVVAGATMCRSSLKRDGDLRKESFFSFLPLAHIYERVTMNGSLLSGIKQGYPHGPLTEILDDIAVFKPSGVSMVPRVLNRIATTLKAMTIEAPGIGGYVSRKAYSAKVEHLRKTGSYNHPVYDALWSRKIRKALGFENLKIITSGSAPLSKENQEFLKVALAANVAQGYGLTESNSGISITQEDDRDTGACGPISITCEVRLRDVPDLEYTSDDKPEPRGEIMLRGPQIFRGYYQNDEKTLEAFDEEGWFHTGDVGKIDKYGRIFIIDRVKNFFKLAQGEYIGAEKIENVYTARSSLVAQLFIHGVSTETYLVGIVGVNPDSYAPFVSKLLNKRIQPTDTKALEETFADKTVRDAVLKALNDVVEPGVLQGFERVKNIRLAIEPLTIENDTITPTLKVKRNIAAKVFDKEIKEMYEEGPGEYKEKKPKSKL
ncbi:hypothetical protein TRICI_002608 [Trichomonascus ciferrii]|uniref:AMP-dependent synthetase/ligase domain-containing protein n=1 Tax=Trichomonascus ciferrii TaxID=44093 RepID=A0A642V6C4_9ASCO|nr:hypothetical protein TRICI_002608 [Trichomonascus ciferrii]